MRIVLFLSLVLLVAFTPVKAQEQPVELRGVWITNVDSDVLFSRTRIAEAMDYLASRGFNVVFPVVWNKGHTLYRSAVMDSLFGRPIDPVFGQRDPLAELIVEAHRNGMEVMPWFEFGFATEHSGVNLPPAGSSHIAQAFPHWMARDVNGQILKKNGFEWMNGLHPGPQEFLLSLIREVIENYDVDGIQGDDRLPAMPAEGGYSDFTRQLYASEHGGAQPPVNPLNGAFVQWKADKLTDYAGAIYDAVKEHDTNLLVSFSPSIWPWSRDNYLQDWPKWLENGVVDVIHPQAYRWSIADYKSTMRQMVGSSPGVYNGYVREQDIARLSPGLIIKAGSQFNDWDYVREAVGFNREYGIAGEVYFFYEGLREKNDFLADSLHRHVYTEPAFVPMRDGRRRSGGSILNENADDGVTHTGTWTSDATAGFDGGMLKARRGSGARIAYELQAPTGGLFDVYAFQPRFRIDATRTAHFTTRVGSDSTNAVIDQWSTDVQGWTLIGRVAAEQGSVVQIILDADRAADDGFTYADAVMLLPNLNPQARSTVSADGGELPSRDVGAGAIILHTPYPHPTSGKTTISFTLGGPAHVDLAVVDAMGRQVALLASRQVFGAGRHSVTADVSQLASGLYVIRARGDDARASRPLVVLR